jgi:hypothetical protein
LSYRISAEAAHEGMDTPDQGGPSQDLKNVVNSAVSNTGTAITINVKGTLPKPWTPPVMLPLRAQTFIGREEDLAWLLEQLQDDAGKTLALCGPGGVGKTALAAEALARFTARTDWLTRFPGGSFYYSFYPNPSLVVAFEELARTFGEELGVDPRRAAVRAYLIMRGVRIWALLACG